MKQINFRKNEKITVGLILLLLCIFLAVLVPALSPGFFRQKTEETLSESFDE